MELTLPIPDDIATRLRATGGDFPRRALEAIVAEEYRLGHLHKPDLRRLLGFETGDQIDTFLKSHNVLEDETLDELNQEIVGVERLGL